MIEHAAGGAGRGRAPAALPATGGGLVLQGVRADDVPTIKAAGRVADGRVTDRRTLGALAVAAAAPPRLRARAERVCFGARGMTLDLRDGPELVFGSAADAGGQVAGGGAGPGRVLLRGARRTSICACPAVVAAGGVGPIRPEPTATPDPLQANPQP